VPTQAAGSRRGRVKADLTIKTLRHYHRVELLEPDEIDPETGYRRYGIDQIGQALVIARFRALQMGLDDIREVLSAPDIATRNAVIAAHLERLEAALERNRIATESLRGLLTGAPAPAPVELVSVPATPAAAITATVDFDSGEAGPWLRGALAELQAALGVQGRTAAGPPGGVYADEAFTEGRGEATLFIPIEQPCEAAGRMQPITVPAAELAIILHEGGHGEIDRSYGALAAYVSEHSMSVPGPIREYYLRGMTDTPDERRWRTRIAWPVFLTGS
jgi:DNA-binding transcriptional MerR regulator